MGSALQRIALMLAVAWVGVVPSPADRLVAAPLDPAPTTAQPKQHAAKHSALAADKHAVPPPPKPPPQTAHASPPSPESLCGELGRTALESGLPAVFFVRLIWQESRFDIRLVSRKGARGIAQFMPGTARSRGLADPFEPIGALRQSARWLKELREQFGNLGLAAAAYNAGPRRVDDWIHRGSKLPGETREYVKIVTGRTADEWINLGADADTTDVALATDIPCNEILLAAARGPHPSSERELDPAPARGESATVEVPTGEQHPAPHPAPEREPNAPSAHGAGAVVDVLTTEPHPFPARTEAPIVAALAPEPPAPSAAANATGGGPWGLQLTGNWSEAGALAAYRDLQTKFPEILGDRPPVVLRGPMPGRGSAPYYRVRVSESTRERATELCTRLQRAGGECFVFRN